MTFEIMNEKMIEIENSSEETQAISGIPAFKSGEKRKMTETEAERVLGNPNFRAVESEFGEPPLSSENTNAIDKEQLKKDKMSKKK